MYDPIAHIAHGPSWAMLRSCQVALIVAPLVGIPHHLECQLLSTQGFISYHSFPCDIHTAHSGKGKDIAKNLRFFKFIALCNFKMPKTSVFQIFLLFCSIWTGSGDIQFYMMANLVFFSIFFITSSFHSY